MKKAVVTGAGGFIGHHLVSYLKTKGYYVIGYDQHLPHFTESDADEFLLEDLRDPFTVQDGVDEFYALAADMGGMGYISRNHSAILRNNLLINVNSITAADRARAGRYLFTSSACIYPKHLQTMKESFASLKESDAYPADPEDAYGWEKLTTEKLCEYMALDNGLNVRIARFHNIFGPLGTWRGGREKAPAALCRKIARAKLTGDERISVWGDGEQVRSFCYVSDCVEALYLLMQSGYNKPMNIGQDRAVTINELVELISKAAKFNVKIMYLPKEVQGVRIRNSDNTLIRKELHWEPKITLEMGLAKTYSWIESQVSKQLELSA